MKTTLLVLLVYFLNIHLSIAQEDTIIYYAANGQITSADKASERLNIKKIRKNILHTEFYNKINDQWELSSVHEKVKILNDSTYMVYTLYDADKGETVVRKYSKKGEYYFFQDFYKRKKIKREGFTSTKYPLHLEGQLRKYHRNGYLASEELYEDNKLISNKNWIVSGKRYIDNIHERVDKPAKYPGGFEAFWHYVDENLRYPGMAKQLAIMGTVYVKFVVDSTGDVVGVIIDKSVDLTLDVEAVRLIKDMPVKWEPATLDGNPVNTSFIVPIDFYFTLYEN